MTDCGFVYNNATGKIYHNGVQIAPSSGSSLTFKFQDESASCDGNNTGFTLTNTPVADSVQIFLNGLLQQPGVGKDYQISGTSITFTEAPYNDDILLINYVTT